MRGFKNDSRDLRHLLHTSIELLSDRLVLCNDHIGLYNVEDIVDFSAIASRSRVLVEEVHQ